MSWSSASVYQNLEIGLTICGCDLTQGDSFTSKIPTDRISSVNWSTQGSVSVYAKDMTLINTHSPGERMTITNPDHLRQGKCVLVCASETAKYYCLYSDTPGKYWSGEVIQLSANEERTISGHNGHFLFCSLGSLTGLEKLGHTTIHSDSYVATAGAEGAIITVYYDSTDD
jgi:hypothetical protein